MTPVGIVTALPQEATALVGRRRGGPLFHLEDGSLLYLAGLGADRSRQAADDLLARGARALVSWGVAGGLDPRLTPGALVLAEAVLTHDGRRLPMDASWRRRTAELLASELTVHGGTLVEGQRVVADPGDKQRLRERTDAVAVDLESAAVARAAAQAGVPCLVIRAICDAAGMGIPRAALAAVDDAGHVHPLAFLRALAVRPASLGDVLRLRRGMNLACASLQRTALLTGPGLGAPWPDTAP
jgi:adenosylhomocysteine nucleosidase